MIDKFVYRITVIRGSIPIPIPHHSGLFKVFNEDLRDLKVNSYERFLCVMPIPIRLTIKKQMLFRFRLLKKKKNNNNNNKNNDVLVGAFIKFSYFYFTLYFYFVLVYFKFHVISFFFSI